MMKPLCVVVVVVLSLASLCHPAPLTCNTLLAPVAEAPDVSGRWYFIALSMPACWQAAVLGGIFQGIAVDVTSKEAPNLYEMSLKMRLGSHCFTEVETFIYENKTIFDNDADNRPTGKPELLLRTGCPDCLVLKDSEDDETLMLLSRRKEVTSEEMLEFGKQSECLGWSTPLTLPHEHEYETCKSFEDVDEDDLPEMGTIFYQILKNMQVGLIKCLVEAIPELL